MQSPNLKFSMALKHSNSLLVGILSLCDDDLIINAYKATSSYPGKQYPKSWREKGGVIPPDEPYRVAVVPLFLPNVRGVEGNFYVISPYETRTLGDTRGDFGIHLDANAPGSLGCVVPVTKKGWNAFQLDMSQLAKNGLESIPLSVKYG
jgi:hypothetical protein